MSLGRSKQLEFTGEIIIEERVAQRENLEHLWRFLLSIQQNTNQHMCVKKLSEARKNTFKCIRGRRFWHSYRVWNSAYDYQPSQGKFVIHRALYRILRKILLQECGIIRLRLRISTAPSKT